MNNTHRYASISDAYKSIYERDATVELDSPLEETTELPSYYLKEGIFGKKKSPASPEDLPSYKKLQTAISDRKKLGDHLTANPWEASTSERKYVAREEVECEVASEYLLSEGIVDNEESASVIINHMSDDWFKSIMEKMSDELARKKAFDMVKGDIEKKHGKDSLISGKATKGEKSPQKYKGDNSDSETAYKKTYGQNKSYWE